MLHPRAWLALCLLAIAGCGSESAPSGLDEPLRVADAAFKHGELPGVDARDGDEIEDGGVRVTAVMAANRVVEASQSGKGISGRITDNAYAIGIRLKGLGSGYWIKPAALSDANFPGELAWQAVLDFGADLPPGNHALQLVAIDEDGHGGVRSELELCVRAPYDDTLNACKPGEPPAAALISLSWDSDADLDLVVVTPSGKTVDQRHPSTVALDDLDSDEVEAALAAPGVGLLSGDSNPDCARDSIRREDLVWKTPPKSGKYRVYANVWNACGKAVSQFKVAVYARERKGKAGAYTYELNEVEPASYGEVLGNTANGGAKTGLFVTTVEFPSIAAAE